MDHRVVLPGLRVDGVSAADEARRLLDNDIAWDDDVIAGIIGGLLARIDATVAERDAFAARVAELETGIERHREKVRREDYRGNGPPHHPGNRELHALLPD